MKGENHGSNKNFYPRPPGGGRRAGARRVHHGPPISIHALRVEGDIILSQRWLNAKISIHALRVEGDRTQIDAFRRAGIFLSTPSGWRATRSCWTPAGCSWHFYPRPPGGGRLLLSGLGVLVYAFLSTPSGWRATAVSRAGKRPRLYFYPRPPGGGRQQKRTKFSSVFAQKGEEFASLRRGKRKFAGGVLKRTNFGF